MAADRPRAKTENLSLRLDPKTKFMIDFMARLRSQSVTSVVEQSIREAASNISIEEYSDRGRTESKWTDFWDPSEGVRFLKLLSVNGYPSTFEEDELRQFTLDHWQFFYTSRTNHTPRRGYVDIIWPNITDFISMWKKTKSSDYWAAGKAMCDALKGAGVKPPTWPLNESNKAPSIADELDDDLPF